ncbi:MAG: hypothetical protein C4520_00500 [Candidatus Abyssobacteria bacterium SURF_5]|uniref:Uncharacterized protein n=1 Tax=Abyssobacteria bacterium (strain SURF_5) TaxID=2093360 RepID=A0A3A4P1S0_ABYX5|nr:MAG: hypothetical protein C4520_00500 [Candidatus Abyssubacteria bacterium SURF_5]
MGHERVGRLPKSQCWRNIVDTIAASAYSAEPLTATLAAKTIENVKHRFFAIHKDKGVQAAFAYLISLATDHLPETEGLASPETRLNENPSPIRLAKQLNEWVRKHASSNEYAEIACRAGADSIAEWTKASSRQRSLFDDSMDAKTVWSKSASARGFCEVARTFFASFTERYLRYFLEREASATLPSLKAREEFSKNLHTHIDSVSKHAFETSKITQSFAAGWFNNHALKSRPSDREIEGFLAIAFGKIQEEMQRESTK